MSNLKEELFAAIKKSFAEQTHDIDISDSRFVIELVCQYLVSNMDLLPKLSPKSRNSIRSYLDTESLDTDLEVSQRKDEVKLLKDALGEEYEKVKKCPRILNGYQVFFKESWSIVEKEYPELKFSDIAFKIQKTWKELPEETKLLFRDRQVTV